MESHLGIKQLELEKTNPMENTGQIITAVPGITSFSDFDEINLQALDPSIVEIAQSDTLLQLQPQPQTFSGITTVRKLGPCLCHSLDLWPSLDLDLIVCCSCRSKPWQSS